MNLISSRLAARSGIRQLHAMALADAAADAAERTVAGVWRDLQRVLRQPVHHWDKPRQTANLLRRLPMLVSMTYRRHFTRLARWGWESAVEPLLEVLPAQLVKAVGSVALAADRRREGPVAESFTETSGNTDTASYEAVSQPTKTGILRTGEIYQAVEQLRFGSSTLLQVKQGSFARLALMEDTGSIELGLPFRIGQPGPAARLTNPPRKLSKDEAAELFRKMLFKAPSEAEINRTTFGPGFEERVSSLSRLAPPEDIAATVAGGFSRGQTPQQVAKDLLPVLDNVRASARRTARTLGMQVAHEQQWKCWEGLGDLKIGYQIHATRDQNTRPKHFLRDKTIYYINPQPGQLGLEDMPRPPLESEREGSIIAHQCRCNLSVVLRAAEDMVTASRAAVFQDVRDRTIPDPVTYAAWFDAAPEPLRRQAVGVRRYQAVANRVNTPRYVDFIDPGAGDLMPVATLAGETDVDRLLRVGQALELIALRRGQIESLLTFGFLNRETVLAWLGRMMGG